jgi:hypothetical protein
VSNSALSDETGPNKVFCLNHRNILIGWFFVDFSLFVVVFLLFPGIEGRLLCFREKVTFYFNNFAFIDGTFRNKNIY